MFRKKIQRREKLVNSSSIKYPDAHVLIHSSVNFCHRKLHSYSVDEGDTGDKKVFVSCSLGSSASTDELSRTAATARTPGAVH